MIFLAFVAIAVDAHFGKLAGLDVALHAVRLRRNPGLDDALRHQFDYSASASVSAMISLILSRIWLVMVST